MSTNLPRPYAVVPFSLALAAAVATAPAQRVALLTGPNPDALQVRVVDPWSPGGAPTTILSLVAIRAPNLLGRTSNENGDVERPRLVVRSGVPRVELPGGDRLFVYERKDQSGHGLLHVPASGFARIVIQGEDALDAPLAVGADRRHVAFVRDDVLVVARLDGSTFAGTGLPSCSIQLPGDAIPESLVVGPAHAFVVIDTDVLGASDRLVRCPLLPGAVATDVMPAGAPQFEIEPTLAVAGNGSLVAFLRAHEFGEHDVWVVGASGPARQIPLPEREYRPTTWIPFGEGHTHLLLNDDGSRLLVTEILGEDELFYVDTAVGGAIQHLTRDALFASYIGVHVLPRFTGNRLLVASGHAGWKDWYAMQPDGEVINLTMTGNPDAPFLLGSLDITSRQTLANGHSLATERLGAVQRLRRLDPNGGSQVLFSDLVEPLRVGSALVGLPDAIAVGVGGERLLSGVDGSVRIALPPGIHLTDPVRGSSGWVAAYAHLPAGLGVVAVLMPDGSIGLGSVGVAPPQLVATAGGELAVLWPDRLEVMAPGAVAIVPLPPANIRVALSGSGN